MKGMKKKCEEGGAGLICRAVKKNCQVHERALHGVTLNSRTNGIQPPRSISFRLPPEPTLDDDVNSPGPKVIDKPDTNNANTISAVAQYCRFTGMVSL